MRIETMPVDRTEARSDKFTEQQAFWNVPLHETNIICDIAVTKGGFLGLYNVFPEFIYFSMMAKLRFLIHVM